VELGEARDRLFLSLPAKPLMVRFDPRGVIPKILKFPRPKEMLIYQLMHDTDCTGKIEAARELIKIADADVVKALGEALMKETFWGTQAEIAEALSKVRMDQARDVLIAGLKLSNPRARRAVVEALGKFRDQKAAQALEPFAKSDPSYFVEATAVNAVMKARTKPAPQYSVEELDQLEKFAMEQLKKESYRDCIRSAAIRALSDLPGINRGERPRALAEIVRWTQRGQPAEARNTAVVALGKVGQIAVPSERARILEVLNHLADEPNFRLRMALVHALGTMEGGDPASVLGKIQAIDPDGRVKRAALVTSQTLQESAAIPESVTELRESLAKLEEEYRKLKTGFEEQKGKSV
jgi:aminopeptidase N